MFEGPSYPNALDESVFEEWLKKRRLCKTTFAYLLVIWDELDRTYITVYVEKRSELKILPAMVRPPTTKFSYLLTTCILRRGWFRREC